MHFDDELLSGNYGMKDIVAVLEWVKEHIGLFGGNADQVTLAGSSSGGAAINWLMYSPLSQGKSWASTFKTNFIIVETSGYRNSGLQ